MAIRKTFSMKYLEDRFKDLSNIQYSSAEEDDEGAIGYTVIFLDMDGKFYKVKYKIDPTGKRYPNPWRAENRIIGVEVVKQRHIKYCLYQKLDKYWEYRQEDWVEVHS